MTRYVIGPDVAMHLAQIPATAGDEHQIVAPALLRSQFLSLLYQAVRHGEMTKKEAGRRPDHARPAARRCRAGPGDDRPCRGAVLTRAGPSLRCAQGRRDTEVIAHYGRERAETPAERRRPLDDRGQQTADPRRGSSG